MHQTNRLRQPGSNASLALVRHAVAASPGWLSLVCVGLSLLMPLGCKRGPTLPHLVPVSGTVMLDGKPLPEAVVQFIPTGSTRGIGAGARTGQDGKYTLVYAGRAAGTVPGTYRVTIEKLITPEGAEVEAGSDPASALSFAKQILPPRYSSRTETTLTATVPEGGTAADFALTSTP